MSVVYFFFFFFKQKTAYEIGTGDWSSDVCSSDLNYIYTEKNGIHIIDLVQTAQLLTEAYELIKQASSEGKSFLFVGTKQQAAGIIAQEAKRCGAYYVNQRWLGGMLTNWVTIRSRVEYLKDLEYKEANGIIDELPKKEAALVRRKLEKLRKNLDGIKNMRNIPDTVIIVDQKREFTAIQECVKLNIPIICILDTNCDPKYVDIPIPANDDAIRSIKLIVSKIADAICEGQSGSINSNKIDEVEELEIN